MANTNEPMTLSDISWPMLTFKSADGTKGKLVFKVWGGMVRIGIVNEGEMKTFFERPLNLQKLALIKLELKKLIKAGPETKCPLVFSTWDPVEKKAKTDWVLAFIKDSKLVYHIEIHCAGNIYKFTLKGPFGIARGSDPMTDADKSEIEMQGLQDFLEMQAPIAAIFSNRRRAPGSWQNNNSGNTTAKPQANSSNDAMDDTDSYF